MINKNDIPTKYKFSFNQWKEKLNLTNYERTKFEDICTEIWVVKCPKELQKNRLIKRDKISEKEAYDSINLQLSFEEKRNFSDIILDNSDDQNKWIKTIKELL